MANEKTNSLLDAISIVAEGVVKKYQYDQTIEAKIISAKRKDQGIYKCEYENAIFDAYSNDTQSFYENEIVYVNIPRGDFSKQKHIVGRKVDLEAAPDRTFNFRMPFDDFVGLESLTTEAPYSGRKGFLANYPEHGNHQDVSENYFNVVKPYNNQMVALDTNYQQQLSDIDNKVTQMQNYISTDYLSSEWHLYVITSGSRLQLLKYNNNNTYLEKIVEACEQGNVDNMSQILLAYSAAQNAAISAPAYLGSEDIVYITDAINKYKKVNEETIKRQWLINRNAVSEALNQVTSNYTNNNYSHLWSWRNTSNTPKMLVETKLGISLDIETNIGTYQPQAGEYGLRIVITGITKPTEEESSTTKTVEYIWKNDEMYGNTYAFYTPYAQQKILDISNFLALDQIDVFFYQNTDNVYADGTVIIDGQSKQQKIARNFLDINYNVIPYSYQDASGNYYLLPYNIYYDNLTVALGLTTDECQTDRVLLYTYDEVMYGDDPFSTESRVSKDTRNLKFAWIHKTEQGDIVLVDHGKQNNTRDAKALETYGAEIHWYHYEYGTAQDTTVLAEKQGGVNWKFLDDVKNSDDKYWVFSYDVIPDIRKAKEKWKAIVTYNGIPYTSTPLVFTNIDASVETNAADQINQVTFRILREALDEQGNRIIKEDNSLTNFFVYDENGLCIQNDQNLTWSDLWFYIQVWIRNNDDGTYIPLPLAVEDDYNNALFDIEWQCPTTNTMLDQISQVSDSDLSNSVLAPTLESNVEGYNDAIRRCTRKFKIKQHWDMRAINNTIAAVVKRNGRIYRPQQEFMFGQSSSMGSPYTIVIKQTLPENNNMIQGEEFEVRAFVFDATGTQVSNKNFIFSWELLAPTIITEGKLNSIDGLNWKTAFEQIKATSDPQSYNVNNIIHGVIRNEYPPVFRVTVTGAADYPIKQTTGFSLVDNSAVNGSYRINCPSKIEFKSDGKLPITINSQFEVFLVQSGLSTHQIHPDWTLQQQIRNNTTWNVLQQDQIKYIGLKEDVVSDTTIVTNANPIVWYQSGNLDAGFSLTEDGTHSTSATYGDLKKAIKDAYDDETDANTSIDENVGLQIEANYKNRITALNIAVNSLVPMYKTYALDPYVNYSASSQVQWQWKDELENLYYTVIQFAYGGNYFKQAIPFTRNVYSSSLLNSWDGTTQIDEANGAVLAQKVSAGAKDKDNRFTGVIMGDWADKADNSLDVPGLYGLKYGEQIFGLKTDGTGFIGKSGKGRIEFDGNKSLISNSDKTCYLNLDPVMFNLDSNGTISDLNDYTGFSQYFLYAKTPKTSTASVEGEDNLDLSTYWAHDFMDDPANDYFIVDPNNGVLTTGGIIARYGKIGNWMISSSGLYQKYSQGATITGNRYMYLGYPNIDKEKLAEINAKYQDLLDANERRRQQTIASKNADFLWEEVGIIGEYYKAIFTYDPYHYFNAGWPLGKAADIVDDALDNYNEFYASLTDADRTRINNYNLGSKSYNTEENKVFYDLLTSKSTIEKYVTVDDCWRVLHAHYTFNVDGSVGSVQPNISIYGLSVIWSNIFPIVRVSSQQDTTRADFQGNNRFGIPGTLTVTRMNASNYRTYTPSNNYYGADSAVRPSVREQNKWSAVWQNYVDTESLQGVISSYQNTLSRSKLEVISRWLRGAYQYHLDGYTRQLMEMINAAIAAGELPASVLDSYEQAKARHEAELAAYIRDVVNPLYDRLAANINSRREKELQDEMSNGDLNRYAIFAGYTPDSDPLFSVNWRGYMTARAGKIGRYSPWYISDYGLTQTNNFGTIFLGNPEAPTEKSQWFDLGSDADNLTLLPNGSTGPTVLGYSDPDGSPTNGKFAIYAGGSGYIREYNSIAHTFDRKISNEKTIKFGVRMDGTLYSTWGQIGNWSITDSTLSNINDSIVLDSNGSQIVLGYGRTVIRGDGSISLGNYAAGEDGNTVVTGLIELAGYQLIASTANGPASLLNNVINETNPNSEAATQSLEFSVNWHYNGVGTQSYSWTAVADKKGQTTTQNANLINANTFQIIESDVKLGNQTTGLNLVTGYLDGSNKTQTGTILYASGTSNKYATLGTETAPWNLFAGSVIGTAAKFESLYLNQDALWLGGERAATQPWVLEKLKELADLIPDVSGSGSSTGASTGLGRARSGSNQLWSQLATAVGSRHYVNSVLFDTPSEGDADLVLNRGYTDFAFSGFEDGGNDAKAIGSEFLVDLNVCSVTISRFGCGSVSCTTALNKEITPNTTIAGAFYSLAKASAASVTQAGTVSVDANGKVSIPFGNSTNDALFTVTFDQADTAFFKAHAADSFSIGPSAAISVVTGMATANSSKTGNVSIGSTNLVYTPSSSKKNVIFSYIIESVDNTQKASGNITVQADKVYDQGYTDGWQAAVAKLSVSLKHPDNNKSGTVTATASIGKDDYLSLAGGTKTASSSLSASASTGSDTHSAKLTYDATMKITNGASFTDGGGTSHSPTGTATWYKNAGAELEGGGGSASASITWTDAQ